MVAGTVALVNGLIAIRRLPETLRRHEPRHEPGHEQKTAARAAEPARESSSRPTLTRIWVLALVGFTAICAFSGFETTFSLFADRRFGLTEGPVALIFLGVGLLLVLVQIRLVGPASDRFGPLGALQIGLVCNALGLCLLSLTHSWLLLVPSLALLTLGQGLAIPNLAATVADRAPMRNGVRRWASSSAGRAWGASWARSWPAPSSRRSGCPRRTWPEPL